MAKLATLRPLVKTIDTRTAAPAPKLVNPFYSSREWRELVALLITVRGARCELCGNTGVRLYADHIKELQDGGAPLDPNNVQILDASCHARKTIAARTKRMAASLS